MRDGFQGQLPEMPWKRRPPIDVTSEDNGPGVEETDPFEDDDDDDLGAGWPITEAGTKLLDNAYRFLMWKRGQSARPQ